MTIRVLVVDDEPLAREGVILLLQHHADIDVIGECGNGSDAIRSILADKPDLVFLDIKMPKFSGFDVIKAVGIEQMPMVIFLTAYDEYAIDAFQVNALDYLLKPINGALFDESLARARKEINSQRIIDRSAQLKVLLTETAPHIDVETPPKEKSERIVVRAHGHVRFIKPEEIQWVEAEGDYINIHTEDKSHLVRDTMRNMEQRLEHHGFQRIHRSVIVKLALISELITLDSGDYEVVIANGSKLKLSRGYRDSLFKKLQADA
ncbi:MAG: two-component system LytT family response regulator [Oceanicoccus sp.]|jgi:two-component system LytT family response regulator